MADREFLRKDRRPDAEQNAQALSNDDFLCLRFKVMYPSFDCAFRTKFKTCGGCANCDQGRFNYRRHASALLGVRPPLTFCD